MTLLDCQIALSDLVAHYDLPPAKSGPWIALVFKACQRIPADRFKLVCERLFENAGRWKPTNEDFNRVYRELAAEQGWGRVQASCEFCLGTGWVVRNAPTGTYIRRWDWRENLAGPIRDVVQDNGRPCTCNQGEGAERFRRSLADALDNGWQEIDAKTYYETLAMRREALGTAHIPQEKAKDILKGAR